MLVGARRSLKPLKVTGSRQLKAIMVEVHVHTCSTPISARIGISASCAEFLLPLWIPACETSSPLCLCMADCYCRGAAVTTVRYRHGEFVSRLVTSILDAFRHSTESFRVRGETSLVYIYPG